MRQLYKNEILRSLVGMGRPAGWSFKRSIESDQDVTRGGVFNQQNEMGHDKGGRQLREDRAA